jgi:hypothetical protein
MWLLLWVLALYALLVHGLSIYVSIAISLIYTLWYLDGREYTGERHWPAFRRFPLWRWLSPVRYVIANEVDLEEQLGPKHQRLYVLLPGNTYFSVLWGIGLHGGRLPPKMSERLHWMVPPLLMAVPLLRDILLWSGAVTYHERKHPLSDVLLGLLNANRSVCYCPAQYANTVREGPTTAGLSEQMLGFAREHGTQLVPILVTGERQRYHVVETPTVLRVQRWTLLHCGYPFPMLVFARYCGRARPPPLTLQFGPIMRCADYQEVGLLRESFNRNISNMVCVEMGDDKLEIV